MVESIAQSCDRLRRTSGELRSDIDLEATIDLLYAPMYYPLQMGTAPLSDAYIDEIYDQVMEGLLQREDQSQRMERDR